jgi:hypothetical protein
MNNGTKWPYHLTRRQFLRHFGIASSAITLSPFFIDRFASVGRAASALTRVYKVKNGDHLTNTAKLWDMLDGPAKYIGATDIVVIKANAQWPNQGYTHTGCIKGIIDKILAIPNFSGEVLICDNIQSKVAAQNTGFDASSANRVNNWSTYNWNELAAAYQASGKPVATKQWANGPWRSITLPLPYYSAWNPANGEGWSRYFFQYAPNGLNTYVSYPVFQSPLTPGRMIDLKNGVWENGSYTGRKVKVIVMPTLNNHSYAGGNEDYAGVTSAVKSFFGVTEIQSGDDASWNGYYSLHSGTFTQAGTAGSVVAQWAGDQVGFYLNTFFTPVLYVTSAMYSGWFNRTATNGAAATNTVLACENPVTLDYISCRDVISKVGSPLPTWLDPSTENNNTWRQLLGCNGRGIGTLTPSQMEVLTYDFSHPRTTRLDVERKIRDFKAGNATEQNVKDVINSYMEGK